MVDKSTIDKIFSDIVSTFNGKCHPTISEMHGILSEKSYEEQFNELNDGGLLNPLEVEHYQQLLDSRRIYEEEWDKFQENGGDDEFTTEQYNKRFQELDDEMFYYGRRLIEGLKPENAPPDIDTTGYQDDSEYNFVSALIRDVEQRQIDSQRDNVKVDNSIEMYVDDFGNTVGRYNDKRLLAMNNYFNGDCQGINYHISHDGYLNALDKETRKQVKDIDSLMKESKGLVQDTVLYRGGHFDIHARVGDQLSFKGYQSTTFQKSTSDIYKESDNDDGFNMTYIIYAPKGTKGICGSDDRFENNTWEHEYVLPRNTKYTIKSIDYDTMTVEVVIDQ